MSLFESIEMLYIRLKNFIFHQNPGANILYVYIYMCVRKSVEPYVCGNFSSLMRFFKYLHLLLISECLTDYILQFLVYLFIGS